MATITKEELLKLARISHIHIHEEEFQSLAAHVQDILSYAARVSQLAEEQEGPLEKPVNVMREDLVIKTPTEPIIGQAPESEHNYFVVPKILEHS